MKITIKPKQKEGNQRIPFNMIPTGYVYTIHSGGPVMLKLSGDVAVLLCHNSGNDCFAGIYDFSIASAYKILGKLTEIVVEKV